MTKTERKKTIGRIAALDPNVAAEIHDGTSDADLADALRTLEARVGGDVGETAGASIPVGTGVEMLAQIQRGAVKASALAEGSLEEAAIAADDDTYRATLLEALPVGERDKAGAVLFAEACVAYGVNPGADVHPIEVLHGFGEPRFKFYQGDPLAGVPDHVAFVTGGGMKVVHPRGDYSAGLDFERRLRRIFRTGQADGGEAELPDNLTLPKTLVDGAVPRNGAHTPTVSYLRRRAQAAARGSRR